MYNVFKRPMFKRGGSTQGTGIMSHVEPRVRAANGFGQFGSQFAKAIPINPNFSLVGKPFTPSSTALTVMPEAPMSTAAAAGLTGLGTLATLTPSALMSFYLGYGAKPREAGEILGMSGEAAGFDQLTEAMSYLGAPGRQMVAEEKRSFEEMNKDETARRLAQLKQTQVQDERQKQFEREQEKKRNESLKEKNTYEASDIKSETVKEANMIRELLKDDDYSKGELALLVAGALKEPGGINAKLDKARELALPLARKRKEEDRAITLSAYKLAKEKDIAKIKAGELPAAGKIAQRISVLEAKDKLTNQEKSELANLKTFIDKETYQQKALISFAGKTYDPQRLSQLSRNIEELEKSKDLSQEDKIRLEDLKKEYTNQLYYRSILGANFKDGGRVNYAEGTEDPMQTNLETNEMSGQSNEFPTKTVEKLSFAQLRDRLPKEITNDVVQLIANSEEALQDFAYIRTQQDINDFNIKYGVNLILPPAKG